MNILVLPKEKYPANRPMLNVLWNREISNTGNSLFWVMQSDTTFYKVKQITWKNSTVYILPRFARNHLLLKFLDNITSFLLKACLSLIIIKSNNISLIHAHDGPHEGLICLILSRLMHIKMSYAYTSDYINSNQSRLQQLNNLEKVLKKVQLTIEAVIYKLILRKADMVFPISHHLKTALHQSFGIPFAKMIVVPEAASQYFLNCVKSKTLPRNDPLKLIYAGSLGRKRNIEFIIDAFDLVLDEYDNVELLLLGWGERHDDISLLKDYVQSRALSDKVTFLGKVPYDQVPHIVSKADIGLSPIPPLDEYLISTPTKCVEYLSLKVPVVANNEIHDQKDILANSNGGILTKYDPIEFAQAVLKLILTPKLREECASSGYEWIKENRVFSKLAHTINKELRSLVDQQHSS